MFNSILVVCVGNICRSPTAEYILKSKINELNLDIKVSSAGLGALVGHPIDKTAKDILEEHGINGSDAHKARQLTREMLSNNDIILVMEESHINSIVDMAPYVKGKVFLLGKWINDKEIQDPYKRSKEVFEIVFNFIFKASESWIQKIS